jgi:hypothetical protein
MNPEIMRERDKKKWQKLKQDPAKWAAKREYYR